jgi:hypothetical protein
MCTAPDSSPLAPVDFGLNEFHRVAWTRQGDSWTRYFDGGIVDTWTEGIDLPAPGIDLFIGRRNPSDGRGFYVRGALDDVRLYDGALSQAEVQALLVAGAPGPASMAQAPTIALIGLAGVLMFLSRRRDRPQIPGRRGGGCSAER